MIRDGDQEAPEVGVVLEALAEGRGGCFRVGFPRLRRLEGAVLDALDRVGRAGRQRCRAAGTEPLGTSERRPATVALLDARADILARLVGRDVVVVEDLVVQLLVLDRGVHPDHVGVDLPGGAVLDGLLGEPLADPHRDGRVSEVVQVALLPVDAGVVGDLLDAPAEILVAKRPVVLAVPVATLLVEDGCVRDLPAGMDLEVADEVALAPGERDGSRGVLDVGILVDGDERGAPAGVDVTDAQARDGADAQARVGKQRDECLVAGVLRGVQEGLDLLVGEEIVRVDLPVGRGPDREVLGPVGAAPGEELLERLPVVPTGALAQFPVVFEAEEQRLDVLAVHLEQRRVAPLSGEADAIQQRDDGALVAVAVGVEVTDPAEDHLALLVGDGRVTHLLELVVELLAVVLDVVEVDHSAAIAGVDYETSGRNPGGTTQNSYIVQPREGGLSPHHNSGGKHVTTGVSPRGGLESGGCV